MLTSRSLPTGTGFTFPNILMAGIDGSLRINCKTPITKILVFSDLLTANVHNTISIFHLNLHSSQIQLC